MALEIIHRQQEGIDIFALKGRLVFGEEDLTLRKEIDDAIASGTTFLVIDLDKVTDIDTTGLGTLLFAQEMLKQASGGLRLAKLRPQHLDLLVVAKMETTFEVFARDQDAINSFFPDRNIRPLDVLELVKFISNERSKPGSIEQQQRRSCQ